MNPSESQDTLNMAVKLTCIYQFWLPWYLTALVMVAKLFNLISAPYLIIFLSVMVSTAVGLAILAVLIILSLFLKLNKD